MLPYVLSSPPGRLFRTGLVLKDAGRKHHTFSGIDEVVRHEPRHFTNNGQKALIHVPDHFARVGHALVAPHRNVHSFYATSFLYPAFSQMSAGHTSLSTDEHDATTPSPAR